jgi:hypothetical protein
LQKSKKSLVGGIKELPMSNHLMVNFIVSGLFGDWKSLNFSESYEGGKKNLERGRENHIL